MKELTDADVFEERDTRLAKRTLLVAIPLATFGLGYWIAPKEQVAHEVREDGFFTVNDGVTCSSHVSGTTTSDD